MTPLGAFSSLAAALTSLEAPVFALSLHVFALTLTVVLPNARRMFGPRYARRHRAAGAAYLALLLVGALDLVSTVVQDPVPPWLPLPAPLSLSSRFAYDVALGVGGTILTLTAAQDFKGAHDERRVRNIASGALDEDQTVTREEMLEHAFYQLLNLAQALFLHASVRSEPRRVPEPPPRPARWRSPPSPPVAPSRRLPGQSLLAQLHPSGSRPARCHEPNVPREKMAIRRAQTRAAARSQRLRRRLREVVVALRDGSDAFASLSNALARDERRVRARIFHPDPRQARVPLAAQTPRRQPLAHVRGVGGGGGGLARRLRATAPRRRVRGAQLRATGERDGERRVGGGDPSVATDGSWPPGWIVAFACASLPLARVERPRAPRVARGETLGEKVE